MLPQVLGQILATLPGPPLIGKLLDNSCYVEKDGQKVTRYGTHRVSAANSQEISIYFNKYLFGQNKYFLAYFWEENKYILA